MRDPRAGVAEERRIDVRTLDALQRMTEAALAHLDEDALLEELLQRVSDITEVDTVAILLLEDGELRARAARGLEAAVEAAIPIPLGRGFAGRVAAERRAISIGDVDGADLVDPTLRERGVRSLLGVPLLAEGEAIGVLHVGSLAPRVFTGDESALLQLAADRAALAIEYRRFLAREREAREAAERATAQLQALQRVTDAALSYLPEEDLLQELLQRVSDIMDVDTVAILLLEGEQLHARAAKGIEEEVEQGVRIPLGRGFAGRIAAERRPIFIFDVDHADILNPILREKGIRSLLGVPLLIEGNVIGVLHVGSLTSRVFTDDETALLQLAGGRAALAIEQARLYEQRRVAEAMQRRLLVTTRPHSPGLEIDSRYLPASGAGLGGDWYDVFPIANGRVGLAVGDVVGHGIGAAAVMGQLRTALRAYAVEGHGPATVVDRVNLLMSTLGPSSMTTLAYMVLDPAEECLELVRAGHAPPLMIDTDGAASFLESRSGIPLGASAAAMHEAERIPLPTGSIVFLYTDGLVERRGEPLEEGLERLRELAEGATGVEQLCARAVEHLVPQAPADDIAFVAARVPPLPEELHTTWPAVLESLSEGRQLLRRWLRRYGATDSESYDIVVACQEACANAIEHAYGPGRATYDVEASYADGRVRIVVRDRGNWREPRGSDRGRGLPIMRTVMDEVEVRPTDHGTEVVLTRELGRTG